MTQLVIIQNRQAVTTSLQIAESFEKEHRNVLRDIEGLLKNEHTKKNFFYKGEYEHPQNKQVYPMYFMNRDGFTLLAMGFTGEKALEFKLKYIQAFNQMEEKNLPQRLSEKEQLKASMRLSLETSEEVETLKLEVSEVKETVQNIVNTMRIDGGQEAQIRKRGNEAVMQALGGKDANAYKQLSKQVFSAFWRDFKDHFQIPRYGDLPKSRFAEGIKFISMWQPSTSLRMDITTSNGQQHLKLVEGGC